VPRRGGEYEQFVYDKFRRLFADSTVTLNDKIPGRESGLEREIDISIRTLADDQELLYIVQCKDRARRPADIVILGEFSAVIRDVGAAKGFLLCTSGFAKSNYQYARTLGIELLTVEDVNSPRWKTEIQIPFIYVKKHIDYELDAELIVNEELVEKNRDQSLAIHFDVSSLVTVDGGKTSSTIQDQIGNILRDPPTTLEGEEVELDLLRPDLQLQVADVWVNCSELSVRLTTGRKIYLKYLTPDVYSHVRDHVRQTTLPIQVGISGTFPILDDTFVEVPGDEPPILPGLVVQVEEWNDLEQAQGKGPKSTSDIPQKRSTSKRPSAKRRKRRRHSRRG
jgi:hypothetical protein